MKESDLFEPVKKHFESQGFVVDGEVADCDILMVLDGAFVAIELKNDLNFKLVMQGAKRQKQFERVYVAVWTPKSVFSKSFRDKIYLLNRLGLGLITVSKRSKKVSILAEPFVHPLSSYQNRNRKRSKRSRMSLPIEGRSSTRAV